MALGSPRSGAPVAELVEIRRPAAHLHAFVCIDDETLGPAFGGCRLRRYERVADAREDARRLARGMTLKNALADIDFGGGKAVILAPAGPFDRQALFAAFGEAIEALGGRYVTAMDAGTQTQDMDAIATRTAWVSGCTGREGDPSPYTALGVFSAIAAALAQQGRALDGAHVAVQGVGHVGEHLARRLAAAGARVSLADVDEARAHRIASEIDGACVASEAITTLGCDVFAPCAFGGVLDEELVERLDCDVVCGAANNQLADPALADRLASRGVLYVPDFLANAGGVVHAALAWAGADAEEIGARVARIGPRTAALLEEAVEHGTTPSQAALAHAARRLARA